MIARVRARWARRDERGLTLIELLIASTLTLLICALVGTLLFTSRGSVDALSSRAEARQVSRDLIDGALGQLRSAKPRATCVRYEDYDASRAPDATLRCLEQRETGSAMLFADATKFCFLTNKDPQATFSGKIPPPDALCVDGSNNKLVVNKYDCDLGTQYVQRNLPNVGNGSATRTAAANDTPLPSRYESSSSPNSTRYIGALKLPAGTTNVFLYGLLPAGVPGETASDGDLVWKPSVLSAADRNRIVAVRTDVTV
ncbi:MAG: PilW family protein, partial [Acidimicrobiia bacterium]